MKTILTIFTLIFSIINAGAQIGYQVALLNQATGEPRANETVQVTVAISDNAGTTICSETKSATTNGAGILSVEIGNASTFENVNSTNLPLWVSATVGDVTIGRTQILSVPVAEYAKHTGELSRKFLKGKRIKPIGGPSNYSISFTEEYCTRNWGDDSPERGKYYISGNTIIRAYTYYDSSDDGSGRYVHKYEVIFFADGKFYTEGYEWK